MPGLAVPWEAAWGEGKIHAGCRAAGKRRWVLGAAAFHLGEGCKPSS